MLEFQQRNHVIVRAPGPADTRLVRNGTWLVDAGEPLRLRLEWSDPGEDAVIDVVTCSDELLQIKIVSGAIE
jgi:hypothetical protein